MVLQKTYQTSITYNTKILDRKIQENFLKTDIIIDFSNKKEGLSELIPDSFMLELDKFVIRNTIAEVKVSSDGKKKINHCCGRCLKAHAIKLANEFGLGSDSFNLIYNVFKEEKGHNGYYLDGDKLIKI